ncbi:hypothetical protein ACH5RR_032413 [Cinchona calisaya]|uniref:F-box domain-containing protein n=1 Tax=Cinchona calisaya TaxID=153742 RepID=A0ABD2YJD3_9GENT
MSILPDELWRRILEIGVSTTSTSTSTATAAVNPCLNYKDLCCLSITCRRLNRIVSSEDSLWSSLLLSDFPPLHNLPSNKSSPCTTSSSSSKALYKLRYERDREQKRLAHRRIVLRIESEIAESSRKIREMELQSVEEREKMRITVAELLNLRRVRQAAVALNVWQPEVIRGKQKQMVEQCDVPVESRISALEMELRLCKQQIANYDKAIKVETRKVERAKEQLESVEYHPLHDFSSKCNRREEHSAGLSCLYLTSGSEEVQTLDQIHARSLSSPSVITAIIIYPTQYAEELQLALFKTPHESENGRWVLLSGRIQFGPQMVALSIGSKIGEGARAKVYKVHILLWL